MALDTDKLNDPVLVDIMERMTTDNPDRVAELTPRQAFEYYCEWNGLINWADKLAEVLDNIRGAEIGNKPAKTNS